jgi:hypothetical protein
VEVEGLVRGGMGDRRGEVAMADLRTAVNESVGADAIAIRRMAGRRRSDRAPLPAAVQISVASVRYPVGAQQRVIGSSFITVRKTSTAPAATPRPRHG